jgi:hypothetical protein
MQQPSLRVLQFTAANHQPSNGSGAEHRSTPPRRLLGAPTLRCAESEQFLSMRFYNFLPKILNNICS